MSDDLVHALRDSKGWPTLGHAAADCIREQRELLDECERALAEAVYLLDPKEEDILKKTGIYRIVNTLAKLRAAQEKTDE